jgi:hypothetical protein
MKCYQIENDVIVNIVLVDSVDSLPNLIEATEHASIGWVYDGASFTNPNHETQSDIITPLKASIRDKRNLLLSKSDWTQVAGAPVDQAAWETYRQALRDIPAQEGFPNEVTWPVEP